MTTKRNSSIESIFYPMIQETIYHIKLENGLPVYIMPKKGFQQKYTIFSTRYGSLDNCFKIPGESKLMRVPDGIAHFLEHKVFENEAFNVFDKFAGYGANVNAYTTYTSTNYLVDTIDNFSECLNLLLDFVQSLSVTDDSIEKEKSIIEQEILMYEDDPDWVTYINLMKAMYHNHNVRIDIAGTVESIYQINRDLLMKCYKAFYHPGNMVLFIVGDVDPDRVIDIVSGNQTRKTFKDQPPIERFYPDEPLSVKETWVESSMALTRPIYYLGFKDQRLGEDGEKLLKKDLITGMLLEILIGKGSTLYQNLYEEGLIDDSFSISITSEIDHGMTIVGGHTQNPDKLHQRIYENFLSRVGKLKEEELERVRKRIIGDYIVAFDYLKTVAQNFISYYFKNMNLYNELKILEEISLDDLHNRLEEHFTFNNYSVSIMYPEGE